MALLRAIYGSGVEKLKLEHRTFKTPSNRAIDVTTVASNFHIEINPGDAGIYDRFVVQEIIKEYAQFAPLDTKRSFKVVVLTEVDNLTKDAQAALRRTMEKYSGPCRLILCCQSPSKVIEPVRSRCLGVRVAAPTDDEVVAVLHSVVKREGLHLPDEFARRVALHSKRNMRKAILTLEACKVQQYPFTVSQQVQRADWESFVTVVARDIIGEQSPSRLLAVRGKLYELLVNCIPPDVIMKTLVAALMPHLNEKLKHEVSFYAARFEARMQTGSKAIFHLEAFVAKFMFIYKSFQMGG